MASQAIKHAIKTTLETHARWPLPLTSFLDQYEDLLTTLEIFLAERDSWDDVAVLDELAAAVRQGDEKAKSFAIRVYGDFLWLKYHMPVFKLTQNILTGFALTDSNITEIPQPFPVFYIEFPHQFWSIQVGDKKYLQTIDALRVTKIKQASGRSGLHFDLFVTGGSVGSWSRTPEELEAGDLGKRKDTLTEVLPEETIQRIFILENVYRNLCLFLSGDTPDVQKERKPVLSKKARRKKAKKGKTGRTTSPEVWIVGTNTKIDKNLVKYAKTALSPTKWTIAKRHVVMGHNKRVRYGPGRSLVRVQWIAPYIRGAQYADKLIRTYTTTDEEPEENPIQEMSIAKYRNWPNRRRDIFKPRRNPYSMQHNPSDNVRRYLESPRDFELFLDVLNDYAGAMLDIGEQSTATIIWEARDLLELLYKKSGQ